MYLEYFCMFQKLSMVFWILRVGDICLYYRHLPTQEEATNLDLY